MKLIVSSMFAMAIAFSFCIILPAIILNAWVMTKLWDWYIIPIFGMQPLSLVHAYGLAVFAAMFKTQYMGEDTRSTGQKIATVFILPLSSLLFGWLGTFFM